VTDADLVWNRAALENGGENPLDGDRALAALLLAHGLVMNGGVRHACSALDSEELRAAVSGYRFFGFKDVGSLLERSASFGELEFDQNDDATGDPLDDEYADNIPNDGVLVARFQTIYAASPAAFSRT
jgi:hypothetical protein